jgi:RND family efflux transporter MFP subunit
LAAAQAALRLAQLDETRATVTAPITGRLGRILTTAGNLVQGGGPVPATVLTTLVSIDPIYAIMDLDEASYVTIAPRLSASVEGKKPVPVQIGLSDETGFPHAGSITFVDNQIDNASGSIRIRASVPNPKKTLTPGAFVRVRLTVSDPKPTILIHEQTVQAKLLTRYVLVVDEKGITTFCPVVLGPAHGSLREVLSGLNVNDTIVATNLAKIFAPGMPVIPLPVDMETLKMHSESATTAQIHR